MESAEHHLAELVKAICELKHQNHKTGVQIVTAVEHLTASVAAATSAISAAVSDLRASNTDAAVEAQAVAIDNAVATLKSALPAPAVAAGDVGATVAPVA